MLDVGFKCYGSGPADRIFFGNFFLGNFPKGSASADRNLKISAAQIEIFHPAKPSADRNF